MIFNCHLIIGRILVLEVIFDHFDVNRRSPKRTLSNDYTK